jgi:hypothetical protein
MSIPLTAPPLPTLSKGSFSSGTAPFAGGLDGLMSIEGTAVQFGILPIKLPRETCSVDAENLLRRLGRFPHSDNPWLPVATLGPCLIFAHHAPRSEDMWGVPPFLSVKVAISQEQYEKIRRDLVLRLSATPLSKTNPLETLQIPSFTPGDLEGAFRWLLDHYPFESNQAEKLGLLYALSRRHWRFDPWPRLTFFALLGRGFGCSGFRWDAHHGCIGYAARNWERFSWRREFDAFPPG